MTDFILEAQDCDTQIVNGVSTGFTRNVTTSSIKNSILFQDTSADLDQWKYERKVKKSGTYLVTYYNFKDTDKGKLHCGVNRVGKPRDTANIAFALDHYNNTTQFNQKYQTTVQIARGLNEFNFKVNGKNASASAYRIGFQFMEFTLIDEHPVAGEDAPAQINQGSMVLLAAHRAEVAESTKTFNLADINSDKYSEITVKINQGEATASLELRAVINGLGTNYIQKGHSSIGGTVNGINITTGATLRLASTSIITGATTFNGEFTVKKDGLGVWRGGKTEFVGHAVGIEETGWSHAAATATKLSAITISTSTSTWKVGTTIEIFGVKRN